MGCGYLNVVLNKMKQTDRSIQEVEKDYWPALREYPSSWIERCHRLRTKPIQELRINEIITLLIQDIGTAALLPIVEDSMRDDILNEDDLDGSRYIDSVVGFHQDVFASHPDWVMRIIKLIESNRNRIEEDIGEKRYIRLLRKLENKAE